MDKASDFESEDCGFDPHRGQVLICDLSTISRQPLIYIATDPLRKFENRVNLIKAT